MAELDDGLIDRVLRWLADLQAGLPGVRAAYAYEPEALTAMPAFVNYPLRGEDVMECYGSLRSLYTVGIELHLARSVLPKDQEASYPYIRRLLRAIARDAQTQRAPCEVLILRHINLPVVWAGEVHAGMQWETDYKHRSVLT